MAVFCYGAHSSPVYLAYSYNLPCTNAKAKLDWQLVILGRAGGQEQRVRPGGQELTHQERTEGRGTEEKREVIWEEGTWSTDTWRWKREREGREERLRAER